MTVADHRVTLAHGLQGSWRHDNYEYATTLRRANTPPGWRHQGDTPSPVMREARDMYDELDVLHPGVLDLVVDVIELHVVDGRMMRQEKIGQWPHPSGPEWAQADPLAAARESMSRRRDLR